MAARGLRRFASSAHLWVGLICGVPAAAIAVTGAVVALKHARPTAMVAADFVAPASIDALLAAAAAAMPGGSAPRQYQPATTSFPAAVQYTVAPTPANPRGNARILIDPVSLTVVPDPTPPPGIAVVLARNFHVTLLAGDGGRTAVGVIAAAMVLLGLTGLIQRWPTVGRWQDMFLIGGHGGRLRTFRDIHGAIGVWFLIVFLFVAASGFILAFPKAFPVTTPPPVAPTDTPAPPITADAAVARALTVRPDAILRAVDLPRAPGGAYRVSVSRPGDDVLAPQIVITVDGARVHSVMDPHELPLLPWLRAWIRPMHEGAGIGWAWWAPVLLSSLVPAVFIVSGVVIWRLKRSLRV